MANSAPAPNTAAIAFSRGAAGAVQIPVTSRPNTASKSGVARHHPRHGLLSRDGEQVRIPLERQIKSLLDRTLE